MKIISIREEPAYTDKAIAYISSKWASEKSLMVYHDCIRHCADAPAPLPQWYLLIQEETLIGCAGLVTNDFISRMDLYPWLVALFIEENHRGNAYASRLMQKAREDALAGGFSHMYLSTDHRGYYEKYGFTHIGTGYHPWGESSRIYQTGLIVNDTPGKE